MRSYRILLRQGILPGTGYTGPQDVLFSDGRIVEIAPNITDPDAEVIDCKGLVVTSGFVDVHVHFRVPGRPDKETVLTGSQSAARGGYTTVCPMPNLDPVPDTPEHLAEEQALIDRDAVIEVLPYAAITLGRAGKEVVDIEALKGSVCGFSDDGSGVQDDAVMAEAMDRVAAAGSILAAHCEVNSLLHGGYIHDGVYAHEHGHKGICSESEWGQIARDVELAEKAGCHYHVCHISTKESVDIIRRAKQRGVNVTCETGPHYLVLCENDLQEEGRFKMNPPLRSLDDKAALIEGIVDGTIDVIATDHAPHTAEEKSRGLQGSAMGIVGLETSFPVLYTKLVKTGVISLEKLLDLMSGAPRRVFGLGGGLKVGERADIAVFDIEKPYTIDSSEFLSKGHATPFEGMTVYGRCKMTFYNGKKVFQDSE